MALARGSSPTYSAPRPKGLKFWKERLLMMDTMRNAAKSWVAKLLIGMLAVSFGVWGIADVFRGATTSSLATVGKQEITGDQYTRAFQQYLQNLARQTGQA